MKKFFTILFVAVATMVSFSSCTTDDEKEAMALAGEWRGDWGMWYRDTHGRRHDSYDTYIKFIPSHSYSDHGYGYQEDFYRTGAYRYLWYKFNWRVRDGIIYIDYLYENELDAFIRDYSLSNDYFSGYFGESNTRFRMTKLVDYYAWTPEIYVESDYYGWSLYTTYSKEYQNGVAGSKSFDNLPKIVERGSRFTDLNK